jgi:hypothetical protein
MILAALVGTAVAVSVSAPNLLIPMWAVLFASLGWNFLEYGVTTDGGPVWGWIICGVVFWAMAAPAVYAIAVSLIATVGRKDPARPESRKWWLLYPVLGAVGVTLGTLSFNALA